MPLSAALYSCGAERLSGGNSMMSRQLSIHLFRKALGNAVDILGVGEIFRQGNNEM